MNGEDEVLNGILQSADRHPNSRVAKLIRLVESERTQKNIVMLLIELAESAEYATDFGISLKYYLDLFERLGMACDIMLNETGLLLLNSSKIYSRRVDYVHELIERQILTLSNADREIADAKNSTENASAAPEKPKRGRKRLLEAPKDPYEVVLAPKKFKKICEEKRFALNSTNAAVARANHVKLKAQMRHSETEQHIHPAGWVHSSIVDLENDEEIDSKRNYKLFTYHVEHRYNTLVPDINFRLHFMVKDYIDEEEELLEEEYRENGQYSAERAITWPPLSEAYVEQYLQLENKLLECGDQPRKKRDNVASKQIAINPQHTAQDSPCVLNSTDVSTNVDSINIATASAESEQNLSEVNESHFADESVLEESVVNESVVNESVVDESVVDASVLDDSLTKVLHSDSGLGESISGSNDTSIEEEVKDEENEPSNSCARLNEDLNSLKEKNGDESDKSKTEMESEISKLESSHKNIENDITSSSILDTSTNISNDAINSTSINSSTISSSDGTHSTTIDLSTSEISANESIIPATMNESNSTKTTDTQTGPSCASETLQHDSALGGSLCDSNTLSLSQEEHESNNVTGLEDTQNDNLNESSIKEGTKFDADTKMDAADEDKLESSINLPTRRESLQDDTQVNLDEIRIHLPHLDDEGVFFSDLDEQEQRMLSPTVMALDVFPSVPNKNNLTIIVDDDIRAMLNLTDDEPETYIMPEEKRPKGPLAITLNIMELPEKMLRRRLLFKLGTEFDLYLKARMQKRKRADEPTREHRPLKLMKWFHMNDEDMSGVHVSPMNSPGHRSEDFNGFSDDGDEDNDDLSDFLGFPEDELNLDDKNHRLSRDSGVDGVEGPTVVDKTTLNTINEEELEESQENVPANATDAVSNNCSTKNTDKDSTKNIESDCTTESENPRKDQEKHIESLSQEVEKSVGDESITHEVAVDEVEKSTKDISGDKNGELDVRNKDVEEITQAQNLDDLLLENDDNDMGAVNDDDTTQQDVFDKESSVVLDDIDLNSTKTKIQQWHEHLQPILAKSRERHHFDVFEIGTEIMNELTQDSDDSLYDEDQPSSINFQDVMENKDSSYVSRYFLSSLLLANQSNINIIVSNKSSEEPTAWKDIQFELLSTKRHTVSIEDNIGMVKKGVCVSEVPKTKTPKSKLKKAAANSSTKNNCNTTVSALSTTSSSSCLTQTVQQETQISQLVNVNLDGVKPLKHFLKPPQNGDDYDSGIFSSEEML